MADFSSLVGIGRVIHEQNQQRDQYMRQDQLQEEADKRHSVDAGLSTLHDAAHDPNATPETKEYASRAYLDMVGKIAASGYKGVKPKEFEDHWMNLGQINMQARKAQLQKTLGVQQAAQKAQAPVVGGQGAQLAEMGGAESTLSPAMGMMHTAIGHALQTAAANPQAPQMPADSEISTSPYDTDQERQAKTTAAERAKYELQDEYTSKVVPAGSTLVQGTKAVYTAPQKYNKDQANLQQAYGLYAERHPELGLTPQQIEADPLHATQARQEWTDSVGKTVTHGGGGAWHANPDPFGPAFIFLPTPVVKTQGGRIVSGNGGNGGGGGVPSRGGVGVGAGAGANTGAGSDSTLMPQNDPVFKPTGEDFLKTIDPREAGLVRQIGEYRAPNLSLSGMGGGSRAKARIMAEVAQAYPDFNAAEYPKRAAFLKDLQGGGGKNGQALQSLNMVIHHMGELADAYPQLGNTQQTGLLAPLTHVVNKGRAAYNEQSGNPGVGNFKTIANTVATELSKTFRGTGSMSEDEIQTWKDQLSTVLSPSEFKGKLRALVRLLAGRVASIDEAWQGAMSNPRSYSVLWPTSRKTLDRMGFDPATLDDKADMPSYTTMGQRDQTPTPDWNTSPSPTTPAAPKTTLPGTRPGVAPGVTPTPAATAGPQLGSRMRTKDGRIIVIKALSPDGSKVTDYEEVRQ